LNLRLATKFLSRKGTAVPIKKAKDILRYLKLTPSQIHKEAGIPGRSASVSDYTHPR
jgi:hypothetical protein